MLLAFISNFPFVSFEVGLMMKKMSKCKPHEAIYSSVLLVKLPINLKIDQESFFQAIDDIVNIQITTIKCIKSCLYFDNTPQERNKAHLFFWIKFYSLYVIAL